MRCTTAIDIDAPAEQVWAVLTDFEAYPEWNRFTYRVTGDFRVGGEVLLAVKLGGQKVKQTLVIRRFEVPKALVWTLRNEKGLFLRGGRTQLVEDLGDGRSRYSSTEQLDGLISPLVALLTKGAVQAGLDSVGRDLKARVESLG